MPNEIHGKNAVQDSQIKTMNVSSVSYTLGGERDAPNTTDCRSVRTTHLLQLAAHDTTLVSSCPPQNRLDSCCAGDASAPVPLPASAHRHTVTLFSATNLWRNFDSNSTTVLHLCAPGRSPGLRLPQQPSRPRFLDWVSQKHPRPQQHVLAS